MGNIKIEKVWLTDTEVWIRTADGNEACEKLSEFPRLKYATPEQRNRFTLSDEGIHWSEIDEDLCFEGFFREKKIKSFIRTIHQSSGTQCLRHCTPIGHLTKFVCTIYKRYKETFKRKIGRNF